jgi:hypothetical protein
MIARPWKLPQDRKGGVGRRNHTQDSQRSGSTRFENRGMTTWKLSKIYIDGPWKEDVETLRSFTSRRDNHGKAVSLGK